MKPGTYPGLPMASYLAFPAVSASLVKTIIAECPRAAWWQSWLNPAYKPDSNDAMDAGTVAHEILLEGSQNCVAATSNGPSAPSVKAPACRRTRRSLPM